MPPRAAHLPPSTAVAPPAGPQTRSKTSAKATVFGLDDLVAHAISLLPGSELRRAAAVARSWRAAVEAERARRQKLPRTQWALLGGSDPDVGRFISQDSALCKYIDVVGEPCLCTSVLPPMHYTLNHASAVVLADGTVYVGGEHAGRWPSQNPYQILRFCPRKWKWGEIVPLPPERARRCITLASPDGVRLLALGGFVGQPDCLVPGPNACDLVDELVPATSSWVAREPLPEKMIDPVVLPACATGTAGGGSLAFWRGDDDEVAYDGIAPLVPGDDVCVVPLPVPAFSTPVAVQKMQPDLVLAAYVDGEHVAVYGSRLRGPWVSLGSIGVVDQNADISARPTLASCPLPSPAFRSEETVVVGHAFWAEDGDAVRSHVGWWASPLDALRRAVVEGGGANVAWRDVRAVLPTRVREGAACVRLPAY